MDVDDTSACPDNGGQCEACGRRPAVTAAVRTPSGVCCVARCAQCSAGGEMPPGWCSAAEGDRAARHTRHLLLDVHTQPGPPQSRWAR